MFIHYSCSKTEHSGELQVAVAAYIKLGFPRKYQMIHPRSRLVISRKLMIDHIVNHCNYQIFNQKIEYKEKLCSNTIYNKIIGFLRIIRMKFTYRIPALRVESKSVQCNLDAYLKILSRNR
jgi:hypothetical protein